tara:strand:- start:1569 stop:2120 length:552 start_codon:yes stop_codon:yes gene_type:complete
MRKKCPKGVFCIENTTLVFLIIITLLICGLLYFIYVSQNTNTKKRKIRNKHINLLMNPLEPPLKNADYFPDVSTKGVPINIQTRGGSSEYRQLGILTRTNGKENILPLMGRPLYTNRNKWQYYTMTDKQNSIKLPISKNGKSCTQEYGCDEIMNGDVVYVEGYKDTFKTTIYDNSQYQYIPYL